MCNNHQTTLTKAFKELFNFRRVIMINSVLDDCKSVKGEKPPAHFFKQLLHRVVFEMTDLQRDQWSTASLDLHQTLKERSSWMIRGTTASWRVVSFTASSPKTRSSNRMFTKIYNGPHPFIPSAPLDGLQQLLPPPTPTRERYHRGLGRRMVLYPERRKPPALHLGVSLAR